MRNRIIAIIGHFGGDNLFYDGQTIKTKVLYDELKSAVDWKILKVDTYYKKHNVLKLIFDTFKAIFKSRDVIVLLSCNGMKVYFPLLYIATRFLGMRVYHDLIGGNLANYVDKYPIYKRYLSSFQVNWVESKQLELDLLERGIKNCVFLPNFKRLKLQEYHYKKYEKPYVFCTFSRIMLEKGIEDAIYSIEAVNSHYGKEVCRLDIYGEINMDYKERFYEVLSKSASSIEYCGIVDYKDSADILKNYYALLFPTYWKGECFPGTIIDAFAVGLPVIATNWNYNSEIINDGYTGIVYPNNRIKSLYEAIMYFIENESEVDDFRRNVCCVAKEYLPDTHIKDIVATISSQWV